MARRIRTARRTDPLPRAFGLHKSPAKDLHVVDATAGLGRDAIVLARIGCRVTAIERVPAICALLQTAVDQLDAALDVTCTDATAWLEALADDDRPDAIYLDPMFAERGRAQVKKDMQACRALAGAPDEAELERLFATARRVARDRVVVKRHPHHRPLAGGVSHSVPGSRIRFDIYRD